MYPFNGVSYSRVCGRVIGYQKGSPDAFTNGIDEAFVDGVVLTRGNPRKHIWTFAAALSETSFPWNGCPCESDPSTPPSPAFVGNDYFCESGNPLGSHDSTTYYTNDPLWDGQQCGPIEEDCCSVSGIPWFNKVLNESTTDDIELRVCCDEADEDVPVSYYEIYIK